MSQTGHNFCCAARRGLLALGCVGLLAAGLSARASTNGIIPYTTRIWQTDEGLPHNSVYALAQTVDGRLWVGTQEGLAWFDGIRFSLVDDRRAPELRRGYVTALCASRDGSLWIACDGHGVTRLKEGACLHLTEAEGLPSNQTRCLFEDRGGAIWIGTESGLARWREGKITIFTEMQGLGDNSVRGLCEDHAGDLRIATKRGLSTLGANGIMSTVSFGAEWTGNALRFVCEDRQGNLWTGSNDGLTRLREAERIFYGIKEGLPDAGINIAYPDHRGQLWVGTFGGLARMVDGKVLARPAGEAVFWDYVNTVFEDAEENLWVGARDGLYRLNPARFRTYTRQQGLTGNNVMSVCENAAGDIWIATWGGGLNRLQENQITAYGATNGLTHDKVLALREGRDGGLWMGMESPPGGLNHFARDEFQNSFPRQTNAALGAAIRVIHEDAQGSLWVGTSAGLQEWKAGKCKVFPGKTGLAGETVWALCESAGGDLWIGTEGGLTRRQGKRFNHWTTREGLSHNNVDALYLDRDQTLWIGTRGGGLNRFKAGKFTAYTTRQGLFSDEVYEILEDDFGFFWMTCRKGLFRLARKELDDFDRGAVRTLTCTAFGKVDGLLSVQFNGVAKPAGCKSRDGHLWFPTIRGVVALDTRIKTNDKPPPVLIEKVIADKRPVNGDLETLDLPSSSTPSHPLTISPGRGELEIHYAALSLQAPEKNLFKYMLEGADSGWTEAGTERTARYSHIGPGTYRFRVIASNNDGVWNETGATVALQFLPHYWQTWSFKGAMLAAAALLLTLLYRARVSRLRALERLRIQIAANLHDDVGARLTKVAMVTELVERETGAGERVKPHIRTIANTTREIIQAMDEIVWTINPKNDTLDNLANYLFQYAQEYFQDTTIRCRLDVPAQLPDRPMSTEARHNLFMAVKEALNNVLKHSGATEVRVGLTVAEGGMNLSIADNGRGFDPDQPCSLGNGLENMRRRLDQIGGRFALESQLGTGTRITMET